MSKSFYGYKNRTHWNVALWICNSEDLYFRARQLIRESATREEAAKAFFQDMCDRQSSSQPKTADGYRYSVTNIRAALVGM